MRLGIVARRMASSCLPPKMSPTTRELLSKVRRMIPPMLDKFHKGQLGRVAVIGGSEDYTGAPYFSAMASARLGCDMSHVICTPAAAAVIKTYSPNLMVHPLLRQSSPEARLAEGSGYSSSSGSDAVKAEASSVAKRVVELFPRLHVLVVGPGLGRDPLLQATCESVVDAAHRKGIPVVIDADALQIVARNPDVVWGSGVDHGQPRLKTGACVLTPNVVEFGRLCKSLDIDTDPDAQDISRWERDRRIDEAERAEEDGLAGTERVRALSRALGGVTVVQKGPVDYITDGGDLGDGTASYGTLVSDLEGGRKRSGGQGDTLTGAIATFLAWRKAYMDGVWDVTKGPRGETLERLGDRELIGLAAFAGSALTRECSRLAFAKHGRSLQASDLTSEVHQAFMNLFGEVDEEATGKDAGTKTSSSL